MRRETIVLHVITGLSQGGAENVLYKLLSATGQEHFKPCVLSLGDGGIYAEKISALGIPVHSLGMRPSLMSPMGYVRLRRMVRKLQPHLLHGWMYHGALAALLVGQGRPVIGAVRSALHDVQNEKFLTRQIITALGRISSRATRIVYCSHISRQQHEQIGYDLAKGMVIPNGFDCDRFCPAADQRNLLRTKLGLATDAFVVGHLGRYHPVKDHSCLLQAFAHISDSIPNACLVMAGANVCAENTKLRQEIEALGLSRNAHLLGRQDNVPKLINGFDILVNSSRSEAFPNVLGEAMACGIPCVATDVGDSAYIIGNSGVIVPPCKPEALAAGIQELYEMDNGTLTALRARARARIIEKFSLTDFASDYETLYENVLQEATGHVM